jgi:hypothetical protein
VAFYTTLCPKLGVRKGVWAHVGRPGIFGNSDGAERQPASFCKPLYLSVDKVGWVYVVDSGNNRIRMFHPKRGFVVSTVHLNHGRPLEIPNMKYVIALPNTGNLLIVSDYQDIYIMRPWMKQFDLAALAFLIWKEKYRKHIKALPSKVMSELHGDPVEMFLQVAAYGLDENEPLVDHYYGKTKSRHRAARFLDAVSCFRFHQRVEFIRRKSSKLSPAREFLLDVPGLTEERMNQIINNIPINRAPEDIPLPIFCDPKEEAERVYNKERGLTQFPR